MLPDERSARVSTRVLRQTLHKKKDAITPDLCSSSKTGFVMISLLCALYSITGGFHSFKSVRGRAARDAISTPEWLVANSSSLDLATKKVTLFASNSSSSDHASYHPTAEQPSKLLIVVPFTARDVPSLSVNLERWRQVGPACDSELRDNNRADIWFYYSKKPNELPRGFARFKATRTYRELQEYFSRVDVTFANLTAEEDDYPVGINLMFFRMVTGTTHTHQLKPFNALYWMEPDVQPIKPHWVNALVRESMAGDDFWVKGSLYLGDVFDRAVGRDWTWVGHINGNAMYRLHQPMFSRFLQIVMDLEPPGHFWKPFDVSIWKVLHDFPYFWHAYQRIAKHFIYSDFVEHWGFTITQDGMVLSHQNPRTFLVHGKTMSTGKRVSQQKFAKNMSHINWDGAIDPQADNVSVLIRSQAIDVDYVTVAISSVLVHMSGALEIVVAVPAEDVSAVTARLNRLSDKVRVVAEEALTSVDADSVHSMQETYTRSMADAYCRGKYVFHMRSDSVLVRKVLHKHLFFAGKPIMWDASDADLPETGVSWLNGTANALGDGFNPSAHLFGRVSERVIPREVYKSVRGHIERVHRRPFRSFLQTRVGQKFCLRDDRFGDCPSMLTDAAAETRAYSEEAVLGAFMFTWMNGIASWLPMEQSLNYNREVFVPIITRFTCQGHAWLAHKLGETPQDTRALQHAINNGNCDTVKDWWFSWAKSVKRYLG
jgi:hypothetical protein